MKRLTLTYALLILAVYSYAAADAIRLTIAGNNYSDQTVVRFMGGATTGLDNEYDAIKLFSPNKQVPAIYTKADSVNPLVVNTYPLLTNGVNFNVYIKNIATTNYTISFEEFGAISPSVSIVMEDVKTGVSYNMRGSKGFSFSLAADSIGKQARFVIHFILPVKEIMTGIASSSDNKIFNVSRSYKGFSVSMEQSVSNEALNVSVFNSMGQLLFSNTIESANQDYVIPGSDNFKGVLIFQLNTSNKMFTQKIFAMQ
jgi:hypothetical protein